MENNLQEGSISAVSNEEALKPILSEKKAKKKKNRTTRQDDHSLHEGHPEASQSQAPRQRTPEASGKGSNNDSPVLISRKVKFALALLSIRAHCNAKPRSRLVTYVATDPKSTTGTQTQASRSQQFPLALRVFHRQNVRRHYLQQRPLVRHVITGKKFTKLKARLNYPPQHHLVRHIITWGKSLKEALTTVKQPRTVMETSTPDKSSKRTKKVATAKNPRATMTDGVSATDIDVTCESLLQTS